MKKIYRKTKRLIIRPLTILDFNRWKNSHLLMGEQKNKWDRKPKESSFLTKSNFKKILKSQLKMRASDKFYDLSIFDQRTNEIIGFVAIMDVNRGLGQSAYIGYFINNNYWGFGYGKEAVYALIDIAFRDLKLHRIEAGIEPTNRRSIMLARSIGLRKEGLKKRAVFLRNKWNDLVIYSATCEEFDIPWKGKVSPRPQ
ncbi:MAG: GNAT family N-acetyltransferase [Oligoflexia bacterium]|nr:GNAT family N-acetyltransferase [Oligoflexia bacterium]